MSVKAMLPEGLLLRGAWYAPSISLALAVAIGPVFGQEPAPQLQTPPGVAGEAAPKPADPNAPTGRDPNAPSAAKPVPEATTATEPQPKDPRLILKEEEARRERIERLSTVQSAVPREGDIFAAPNIPLGLLPRRGLTYGRIILLPSVNLSAIYTDNANSGDELRESDVQLGGGAAIRAETLLRRHALGVEASAVTGTSLEGVDDDFFDWQVGADGRFDLDRQNSLNGGATASLAKEADSSAEAIGDDDATVNNFGATLGYLYSGRRLDVALNTAADREDFSGDNTAERDNTTYTIGPRLTQKVSDRLSVFIAPSYAITRFDEEVNLDGIDRDATQVTGVIGADYVPRARLTLGGSIGYSQAFFDDPDADENGSVVGSLNANYAFTARTSFSLAALRQIEITTVDEATSETVTTVSATASHQLAPKHAVSTELSYTYDDFEGADRVDQDITAGVNYFFRFDEHVVFNLGYEYFNRSSDIAEEEFYENRAIAGITLVY